MTNRNYLNKLFLAALMIVALCAAPALAADPNKMLEEEEINLDRIKTLFTEAYMDASIDSDGDLKIQDGGLKTFVRVSEDKKLITFFAAWPMRASVSDLKKLEYVNRLNDELIFVRFMMTNPTRMWCDYQFLYDEGITPLQIINNYRLFIKVVKGAVNDKDPDDIIGKD